MSPCGIDRPLALLPLWRATDTPQMPPNSPEAKPIIISNPTVSKAKEAAAKFNLPEYTDDAMKVLRGGRGDVWAHLDRLTAPLPSLTFSHTRSPGLFSVCV